MNVITIHWIHHRRRDVTDGWTDDIR